MTDHIAILRDLHAHDFLRAHEVCAELGRQGHGLGNPAIMCGAFAAEMALKNVLFAHGIEYKREHSLSGLFDKLPDADKAAIRASVVRHFPDFDDQLKNASNAFVEWRYFFESKNPLNVNVYFIGSFARAAVARQAHVPTVA